MATAKADKKDIREISASIGMHYMDLPKAIERIKLGMFYMYYRHDAKADWQIKYNETLKKAFKEYTGNDFDVEFAKTVKTTPLALMGPPGHGKTTAFKVAAKWFAKSTGLKYVDRVDISDYVNNTSGHKKVLDRDTFLFVSQEFSGEVSKAGIGLPFKSVGTANIGGEDVQLEYMRSMMPGRFQLMREACASVLLLDDFVNASPSIQNIALSIANENRFQDMDYANVYIGVTGNLGAIDGTNTSKMSSALVSRLESHVVADNAGEFANRLIARTADKIGDLGVSGYLRRNAQEFWKMPDRGAFPCPRTWDAAIDAMRIVVQSKGGSLEASLDEINDMLPSHIGQEGASFLHTYLHQLTIGADPLARKMIHEGVLSEEDKAKLAKGYGDGFKAESLEYAFQFGSALADYAAQKIVLNPLHKDLEAVYQKITDGVALTKEEKEKLADIRGKIVKETMERFILGMSMVTQKQALAFGIQQLSDKLSYQLPAWSQEHNAGDQAQRVLRYEVKEAIVQATAAWVKTGVKGADTNQIVTIIDAITNHDQQSGGMPTARKKK